MVVYDRAQFVAQLLDGTRNVRLFNCGTGPFAGYARRKRNLYYTDFLPRLMVNCTPRVY